MNDMSDLSNLSGADIQAIAPLDLPEATYSSSPSASLPSAPNFDYSDISEEVAKEAQAAVKRILDRMRTSIIETGNDLLSVKKALGHGKFGQWLKFHFTMSEGTAENYMNAARAFSSSPFVLDALPIATVYKLASKNVPEDIRESVVKEIEAGATPGDDDVQARIITAKAEFRRKRFEEKQELAAARKWKKHSKSLKREGKTDEAIEVERKRWEAEVLKDRRENARLSDQTEHEKRQEEMEQLARIIKTRLGSDYDKYSDILVRMIQPKFRDIIENTNIK